MLKLYHVTKAKYKESILEKGLLANPFERCVYLAPTKEGALAFVFPMIHEFNNESLNVQVGEENYTFPKVTINNEFVLFEIDVKFLNKEDIELSDDHNVHFFGTEAYRYYGDIPTDAISKIYDYNYEKKELTLVESKEKELT